MTQSIAIVGAGAVGSILAAALKNAGLAPSFVDPRKPASKLHVELEALDGTASEFSYNCRPDLPENCQVLLLCLKAYQVEAALAQLSIPKGCQLVLLNNGLGAVPEHLNDAVIYCSNTHGALLQDKHAEYQKVLHTGAGTLSFGYLKAQQPVPPDLQVLLSGLTPLAPSWNSPMAPQLWLKLAVNCCINPLTALHNQRNGALLNSEFHAELESLCQELCGVAQAEGIQLEVRQVLDTVLQVAKATAANYSSMHQDVQHQRRTEIDFINGYLVARAEQHGLSVPNHQRLVAAIKNMEQNYA